MIEIEHLTKIFEATAVKALNDISLKIEDGDIYGIIGMSGAGKSTLVRCINMLEKPTQGTIKIDGVDLSTLSQKELREMRKKTTMIFQSFNLLMQRNCLDNITFALELDGIKKKDAREKARELLDLVGLKDKEKAYPAQLSGGQKQRIAIARALATNPKVLLCDEATSALDPTTTASILELIRDINKKLNITVIIITHQMSVVENICHNVAIIDNGEIAEVGEVSQVFAAPKSLAAKKLVFPEGNQDSVIAAREGERFIRVVFDGSSLNQPIIARMAVEKKIEANIAYASTRTINEKSYGSMLLSINGDKEKLEQAISYLSKHDHVIAKEVTINE